MAPFAVSITKRVLFRGSQEQFSNVYHYDLSTTINTDAGWDDLIAAIVAKERPFHSTQVTFVEGRVWGPTNQGQLQSITRRITDLTGTGQNSGGGEIWPELCIVASFFVGRNPATQRKRFLRKYFHVQALMASTGGSGATLGRAPLAAADKTPIANAMNDLKTITIGTAPHDLCTPQGDHLPLGSSPKVLDHLHVRQFKQ